MIGLNGVRGGEGECMRRNPANKSLTLTRCHSCGLLQLYESLKGWKSVCVRIYNLNYIKREIFFLKLCFSFTGALFLHDACRPRGDGSR